MSKKALTQNPVQEIKTLHGEITEAMRVGLPKAIRIGELLTREHAKLKHGKWLLWVKSKLPFTDRTARNYIQLFENRKRLKLEMVSDLTSAYRLIQEPRPEAPRLAPKAPLLLPPTKAGHTTPEPDRAAWELNKIPAPAEHHPDDKNSSGLLSLKYAWRKAGKGDRATFWKWALDKGERSARDKGDKSDLHTFRQTCDLIRVQIELLTRFKHPCTTKQPAINVVNKLVHDFMRIASLICDTPKCGKDAKQFHVYCVEHGAAILKAAKKAS